MYWWLIVLAMAALLEFLTWKTTGNTLSQHLWRLQRKRPWVRWVTLFIGALLVSHLAFEWP